MDGFPGQNTESRLGGRVLDALWLELIGGGARGRESPNLLPSVE